MTAGYWLIYTTNDAGETVRLAELAADAGEAAVVAKLRDFVWLHLSKSERAEMMRTDDGGIRMAFRKTDTGYTVGTGPTYGAKFVYSL